ncbi:Cytochrome P450 [Arachis hypogaea]|nr:Cytochrome P450 [Arachis hypogaea]
MGTHHDQRVGHRKGSKQLRRVELFKPWRFFKANVPDFKGSNFQFIPFGSGRRSCSVTQLRLYALELAVAHLLHCFTWELLGGMKLSEMDSSDIFELAAPRATRFVAFPQMLAVVVVVV